MGPFTPVLDYYFRIAHLFLLCSKLSFFAVQSPAMGMISRSILQILNLGNP